jgi:hypothetical protein
LVKECRLRIDCGLFQQMDAFPSQPFSWDLASSGFCVNTNE